MGGSAFFGDHWVSEIQLLFLVTPAGSVSFRSAHDESQKKQPQHQQQSNSLLVSRKCPPPPRVIKSLPTKRIKMERGCCRSSEWREEKFRAERIVRDEASQGFLQCTEQNEKKTNNERAIAIFSNLMSTSHNLTPFELHARFRCLVRR